MPQSLPPQAPPQHGPRPWPPGLRPCLVLGAVMLGSGQARAQSSPPPAARAPVAAASTAAVQQLPAVSLGAGSTEGFRAPPQHAYAIDRNTLRQQTATQTGSSSLTDNVRLG